MRLSEFNNINKFLTSIRIANGNSNMMIHTSTYAGSQQQARAMLRNIFGKENVLSVTEIVKESTETDQIQLEQHQAPPVAIRQQQAQKNAQIQPLQVSRPQTRCKRQIPAVAIPDQVKHRIIQKRLTAQMLRQGNIVKPTADDIRIARDEAEVQQKRADLEYGNASQFSH